MKPREPKTNFFQKFKFVHAVYILISAILIAAISYMAYIVILRSTSSPGAMPPFQMSNEPEIVLCLLSVGLAGLLLPVLLVRKLRIKVPAIIPILWAIFIFSTVFLGEVCGFYHIAHYDKVLHALAAFTIAILGFMVIDLFNKPGAVTTMKPFFIATFAFCFSFSINVLWEVYEFIMDSCFADSNMQRFMVAPGYPFIGQDALSDTMRDIVIAVIGALVAVIIVHLYTKHRPNWLKKSQLKRI